MNSSSKSILPFPLIRTFLIDGFALAFLLLMPAASHLTGVPFYFIEPMRIMLVVALIFTSRSNAYILALALPVFSFLVSGHPVPIKMMIIMAELLLNVWLFIKIFQLTRKPFISMFSAIIGSKIFCYLTYWIVFSWAFVVDESQMVFLIAQLVVSLVLSASVLAFSTKRSISSTEWNNLSGYKKCFHISEWMILIEAICSQISTNSCLAGETEWYSLQFPAISEIIIRVSTKMFMIFCQDILSHEVTKFTRRFLLFIGFVWKLFDSGRYRLVLQY